MMGSRVEWNARRCLDIASGLFLLVCLAAAAPRADAQTQASDWLRFEEILPTEIDPARNFGQAMAATGDLAAIGAPSERVDGKVLHGAVYVYERVNERWRQRARIVPSGGTASMHFGSALAIHDGQLLIGAYGAQAQQGRVFVYSGSGSSWSLSQTLQANVTSSQFGYALALSGNRLAVGAPQESQGSVQTGVAYVFEHDGTQWLQTARLVPSSPQAGARFGRGLALSSQVLAVGAPWQDDISSGSNDGAVYVFEHDGGLWNERQRLAPQLSYSAYAGDQLALVGDELIVAAYGAKVGSINNVGSVLRYQRDGSGTWSENQRFHGRLESGYFGNALHFDGAELLIGADGEKRAWGRRGVTYRSTMTAGALNEPQALPSSTTASRLGTAMARFPGGLFVGGHFDASGGVGSNGRVAIYAETGGEFTETGVLTPPQVDAARRFGHAVAISGTRAAVGAPWQSVNGGAEQGSVMLYDFDGQHWTLSATLVDPAGAAGDRFGNAVALEGNRLVVGATHRDNDGVSNSGSALLFEFDGSDWQLAFRYDNRGAVNEYAGTAVALRGDLAAIGVPRTGTGGISSRGAAVLLARNGSGAWSEIDVVLGSSANARLGSALALTDRSLFAGAPNEASGAGKVRIYRESGGAWTLHTTLDAPPGAEGFGRTLATDGGRVVIGAPNAVAGQVAVYRDSSAGILAESALTISGPATAYLGSAVAISGNWLFAGSLATTSNPATLHAFRRTGTATWNYEGRLSSPDGVDGQADGFGTSLALDDHLLLAGAAFRPRDEGRVFAYAHGRASTLSVPVFDPVAPVSGEPFIIDANASTASGNIAWTLDDGQNCVAMLSGGAGNCALSAVAGTRALIGRLLPQFLPDLPTTRMASLVVSKASSTVTLSATPAMRRPGETVTLSASVLAQAPGSGVPTGMVRFYDGDPVSATLLCEAPASAASCMATSDAIGTVAYQARYLGDTDFLAADSNVAAVEYTAWPVAVTVGEIVPALPQVDQVFAVAVAVTSSESGAPAPVSGRVRAKLPGAAVSGAWAVLDAGGLATVQIAAPAAGSHVLQVEFDGQSGVFSDAHSTAQFVTVQALESATLLSLVTPDPIPADSQAVFHLAATVSDGSAATGSMSLHLASTEAPSICYISTPAAGQDCNVQMPQIPGMYRYIAKYSGDQRAAPSQAFLDVTVTGQPPRQIRVMLDDGIEQVAALDPLEYELTASNLSPALQEVGIRLRMDTPVGAHGMQYQCIAADNGAVCPDGGLIQSPLDVDLVLPSASQVRYRVTAQVDDPPPFYVEAIALAQLLGDGEVNDDPDALIAIDVNLRADGMVFSNGFE
ncbi:MAG: Ig-like domain repeat protein [Lysobacteraceae bacterium]